MPSGSAGLSLRLAPRDPPFLHAEKPPGNSRGLHCALPKRGVLGVGRVRDPFRSWPALC